jgi:hypothetical protein
MGAVSRRAATLSLVALALGLASCASTIASPGRPTAAPSLSDDRDVVLTTQYPVLVVDDGRGAELCVGGVDASLPPQCDGPLLVGWDWSEHEGRYERLSGVTWGEFIVTGRYSASSDEFVPTEILAGMGREGPSAEPLGLTTPCREPSGGWRVLDESTTTDAAMQAVFERTATLDGYSSAWVDQSMNPASEVDPDDTTPSLEWELGVNDPLLTIVNVRVVGDPVQAESELRSVWGGMLCVSTAERTEAALRATIDLVLATTDGVLTIGQAGTEDHIEMLVIHDDGTLQRRMDSEFGDGVVEVTSALTPAT